MPGFLETKIQSAYSSINGFHSLSRTKSHIRCSVSYLWVCMRDIFPSRKIFFVHYFKLKLKKYTKQTRLISKGRIGLDQEKMRYLMVSWLDENFKMCLLCLMTWRLSRGQILGKGLGMKSYWKFSFCTLFISCQSNFGQKIRTLWWNIAKVNLHLENLMRARLERHPWKC